MMKTTITLVTSALILVGCGSEAPIVVDATHQPPSIADTYDYKLFEAAWNLQTDEEQFRACANYIQIPDLVLEIFSDDDSVSPEVVEAFLEKECITGN